MNLEQAKAHCNMGLACIEQKQYQQALEHFYRSRDLFLSVEDLLNAGGQLGNIGALFRDLCRYDDALSAYFKALDVFKKIDFKPGIADQSSNIAYIYAMQNNLPKAMEWFETSLALYKANNKPDKTSLVRTNIENLKNSLTPERAIPDPPANSATHSIVTDSYYLQPTVESSIGI